MARPLRASLFVACAALTVPTDVGAAAWQVQARTEAQAYQFRAYRAADSSNPTLLSRRQIVQYLGLDVFELVTGEDLGFESSLRVFADLGLPRGEAARIDGLRTEDLDLLYAHVRWRKEGLEGVLGRQFFVDAADYFAFDGARLRWLFLRGIGMEVFGGLWVKGAMLLGSSGRQLDGIREMEQELPESELGINPFLNETRGPEPVIGARVVADNLGGSGLSGAVGYRRSFIGSRLTSERAGLELTYGKGLGINLFSGAEYDLVLSRLSSLRAHLRYDAELFAASVEALRFTPTFSTYSLWYYFAAAPRDEVRVRGDLTPPGPLRFYAQVLGIRYGNTANEALGIAAVAASDPATPTPLVFGAGGGAQLVGTGFRSGADLTWRNGWGGRQLWVDLTGGLVTSDRRWTLDGRVSFASVRDAQNPLLQGEFFGVQLWGSFQISPGARASLVFEQNVNEFIRSDTRGSFVLDLRSGG